jgi:TRAP-type C4-dicarboxylate transport system permease small subunit
VNFTIKSLLLIFKLLENINTFILRIGRQMAWIAILLMVIVIIIQVFFRYVLNNALPWPDEAARFLMLWMTGLIAPSAYRWGGFVSIDMIISSMPKIAGNVLTLLLLILSLFILIVGLKLGLQHIKVGWIFNSSSIKIPLFLIGEQSKPIKLAWMYMSLPVGISMLILVNIELIFIRILSIINPNLDAGSDEDQRKLEA